jgi:hypothetical protein
MNDARPTGSGALNALQFFAYFFAAVILLIIAAVFSFVLYRKFVPPEIVVQADAGFKRAQKTIDPEKLRAWALDSMRRLPGTNGSQTVPDADIPGYIKNLYSYPPERAYVNEKTVIIIWGGGFFGWALTIGDTNYSEPFKSDNSECPYNFEWTNGIYYTREANWKLQ